MLTLTPQSLHVLRVSDRRGLGMERGPLVGRGEELAAIRPALAALAEGRGGAVVVAGDPGIGKTRILDEVAALGGDLDALVLDGRASEFELFPFGVFVDALDDYLRTGTADLAVLGTAALDELAMVFPSLRVRGSDGAGGADDRLRAYAAVRALLELLASERPVVLVLDDLHWSDRASLELVAHLLRRPPQAPVMLACGYRTRQVDADLAAVVARAARDGDATYVELGPLARADAGALVDARGEWLDRLYRATDGNPFYLLELARTAAAAPEEIPAEAAVPPSVARAIVSELDPLPARSREFGETAAVAGDPFEFDVALAASALGDEDAFAALDDLAAHGIIRPTDVPRRFAFRHPLVRQAIYEAMPPGSRLAAHERCADALAVHGDDPAARAHHVEHAARPGDLAAVEVLAAAAEQTAARAPANAARWLRTALRLLPPDADPSLRRDLLRPLPALLVSLGEPEEAHAVLLEAIEATPQTDAAEQVALATTCATLEQFLGRHDVAHERLTTTLAALPEGSGREAVSLMIALVMDGFYRRNSAEVQDWGRRAIEEARRLEDRPLEAAATAVSALCHALSGSVAEAERHRSATLALLDGLTDVELAGRLDVLGGLSGAELYLDHYEEAAAHAERAVRLGQEAGTMSTAPTLIPTLGTATWVLGRLDRSLQLLDQAVESARAVRDPQTLAWRLFNLGLAQTVAGQVEAGRATSSESLALARSLGDSVIATWAGATLGLAELECGDAAAALTTLSETCGGPTLPNIPGGWRVYFVEAVTRCLLALGRPEEAATSAEEALASAAEVGLPHSRSMAHRAMAACALAAGDATTAAEHALVAVREADAISARLDAARARILAGRAQAAAGDTDGAVAQLQTAAEFLDSCGCVRLRDEAELELGRLGRRPHRRTRRGAGERGVAALTSREREVADLVVRRHTNVEIAELLFLSGKTVETHLRNIFRKLDVGSRADVARVVEAHRAPVDD